jgi:hypothetical protein
MAYNITNLKADLAGVLHGTTLNQIVNLNGLIYRAARDVLQDVDMDETQRIVQIANPVFQSVYDYPCPTDVKGNRIIDIRPQVNRQATDLWRQIYPQAFDLSKQTSLMDGFAVQYDSSIKSLRINAPFLINPVVLNSCDSLTSSGTWTAGSSASGLVIDNQNYVSNSGSLQFNLAAAGSTGYVENSTMTAQDISAWLNQGTLFLYVYLPTASDFTNINLKFGSSSSAYYSVTATTTQEGTIFQNGWNLIAFPWLGATVVGSPDPTKIKYLRVTYTYNGNAQTAVRLDQITASLGTIMEIVYYSKFLFRDAITGAFQETVTDDTNLINLDTESYNLLFYKVAQLTFQQQQGLDASFYDGPYSEKAYQERLNRYFYLCKSQVQKVSGTYYKVRKPFASIGPRIRRGF